MSESQEEGEERYIPQTEFEKTSKLIAKYVEFAEFAKADTSKGYYCGSCIYFFGGIDDCAIVFKKGESADGLTTDHIAPYGMCSLWKPNWDVIRKN